MSHPVPMPTPGHTPGMPGSSPVLDASPLDSGGMIRSTLNVVKAAPGMVLGLVAAQMAVVFLALFGAFAVVIATLGGMAVFDPGWEPSASAGTIIATSLGSFLVAMVAIALASVKLQAMVSCAVDQVARGGRPTWGSTAAASRGVVGRALGLYLLFFLAYAVVMIFFSLLVVAMMALADDSGAASAAAGLLILAFPVLCVLGLFVTVRLLYVNQVLAIEGASGLDVLRRAWTLTEGRFWPRWATTSWAPSAPWSRAMPCRCCPRRW